MTSAAATTNLSNVVAVPTEGGSRLLPGVSGAGARRRHRPAAGAGGPDDRRPLAQRRRHEAAHAGPRCSAPASRSSTAYLRGENRTIRLNDTDFGVVGVLGPVALDPDLDNAVFITQWAAKNDFATDGEPESALRAFEDGRHAGRRPTRSRPRSTSAAPTRCRRRCRATCSKPRRRPTRRCNRPRCSPDSSRSRSAVSASRTSCRSR